MLRLALGCESRRHQLDQPLVVTRPLVARNLEGRAVHEIDVLRVRLGIEQRLNHLDVAFEGRHLQRGLSIHVGRVDRGAVLEEETYDLEGARLRGG